MKYAVFTSNNSAYLPNARILAESLKKWHPDWDFFLLFNDRVNFDFPWDEEPFDSVVHLEELNYGSRGFYNTIYKYSVIELCTATKGVMAEYLLNQLGYDVVIYLDPDMMVMSPMIELIDLVNSGHSFVLTPHLTDPEQDEYEIWSHEMAALKHGTFNLGFFMVQKTGNGLKALNWWANRLLDYSFIDFNQGLFTDQKWANLIPYIFDDVHVLLARNYNVATWNNTNRNIKLLDGKFYVNNLELRLYHFSGFGKDFLWADHELNKLDTTQDLINLWNLYKRKYLENQNNISFEWFWGKSFSNGRKSTDHSQIARLNPLTYNNLFEI
jgi:hypothetical protein